MWWRKKQTASEGPSADRILPRVRHVSYVDSLRDTLLEAGAKERDVVPVERFVGDLVVAYGFEEESLFEMLSLQDLKRLGIEQKDLEVVALQNLIRRCGDLGIQEVGPLFSVVAPGDFASSALLLVDFWSAVRDRLQSDLVVAAPTRDIVLLCAIEDTQAVTGLTIVAESDENEGLPDALTSKLLVWDGSWSLLEDEV